jgi:hypothetical protein
MSGYAQWSPFTTYPPGEIVSYASALWQSLQITTNNQPNISPTFWSQVGGSGGVSSIVAGTGISVSGTSTVTVSNTGVLSVASAGAGITIGGTASAPTVQNDGVLSVTSAGAGITIGGTASAPTVQNTGVLSVASAGTGITIGGTASSPTVQNDGVLALTAGSGVSITGTPANYTIAATGSGGTLTGITAGTAITVTPTNPAQPTVALNADTGATRGVFLSTATGSLFAQLNPDVNNGTKVAPNGGGAAPTATSLGGNSLFTTGYGFVNFRGNPQSGGNDLQTCIVYSDNSSSTPFRPIVGATLAIFNNNDSGQDNMNFLIYYEDTSGNVQQFGNIQLSPQNIGYITVVQHNPDNGVNPLSCPYAWIFSKITNSGRYG